MAQKEDGILDYNLDSVGNDTHPPKFGVVIPNRIFVGGIPSQTQEADLFKYFSDHGAVKDVKIIMDRAGVSKGYGFVTFDSNEDVKKIQQLSESLIFRERKLNVGPAIKKQQPNPKLQSDSCENGILNNGFHPNIGAFFYPHGLGVSHLFYGPTTSISSINNGFNSYPCTTLTNSNVNMANPGLNGINVNGINLPIIPSNNPSGILLSTPSFYPHYVQPENLTHANINSGFIVSPASSNVLNHIIPSVNGNAIPNNSNNFVGHSHQVPLPLLYSAQPIYYPSYPLQNNIQSPGNSPLSPSTGSSSTSSFNPKWINSAEILQSASPHFVYKPEYIYQMNQAMNNGSINMQALASQTSENLPGIHYSSYNTYSSQMYQPAGSFVTTNISSSGSNMHIYKENDPYAFQKASNAQQPLIIATNNHGSMMTNHCLQGSHMEGIKD